MSTAKLLYENGANWHYATGTPISDPALWYQAPSGQTHIIVSDLEIGLMRTKAKVDNIHGFEDVRRGLGDKQLTLSVMVEWLLNKEPATTIEVPSTFPVAMFQRLSQQGLPLAAATEDLFFPHRAVKTLSEVEKLATAQRANEQCFHHAAKVLRESDIARDGTLFWKGATLTAEILQAEMNKKAIDHGAIEFHNGPIVACGAQGAFPHERGHGPLRAHELIVIDCFPRHANGYWGDLTRTFIKGKPSGWQNDLYNAVLHAQEVALSLIRPGENGKDIHLAVARTLADAGFKTDTDVNGIPYGFFHGTGHGVGLDLHEPGPRTISQSPCILKSGYVTSVEPGLYYPPGTHKNGVGGCRIEDVVVVTENGHQNLTTFPKDKWIID
jgi:Xaa-Pro aminopeptidase